jgi:hypothetical protein
MYRPHNRLIPHLEESCPAGIGFLKSLIRGKTRQAAAEDKRLRDNKFQHQGNGTPKILFIMIGFMFMLFSCH